MTINRWGGPKHKSPETPFNSALLESAARRSKVELVDLKKRKKNASEPVKAIR